MENAYLIFEFRSQFLEKYKILAFIYGDCYDYVKIDGFGGKYYINICIFQYFKRNHQKNPFCVFLTYQVVEMKD
jgi:hypothetical protein